MFRDRNGKFKKPEWVEKKLHIKLLIFVEEECRSRWSRPIPNG